MMSSSSAVPISRLLVLLVMALVHLTTAAAGTDTNDSTTALFPSPHLLIESAPWTVVSYRPYKSLQLIPVLPEADVTALFLPLYDDDDDDYASSWIPIPMSGNAGCNYYTAKMDIHVADGTVSIYDITSNMPGVPSGYCLEPMGIMEQEEVYLQALLAVRSFRIYSQYGIEGDETDVTLDLLDDGNNVVIRFVPMYDSSGGYANDADRDPSTVTPNQNDVTETNGDDESNHNSASALKQQNIDDCSRCRSYYPTGATNIAASLATHRSCSLGLLSANTSCACRLHARPGVVPKSCRVYSNNQFLQACDDCEETYGIGKDDGGDDDAAAESSASKDGTTSAGVAHTHTAAQSTAGGRALATLSCAAILWLR